ncbi:MAG TPA: tetratricopeptide repeat protein [Candidatus Polarisedimenticolaceae bacterium]|nr:tetratricopeptide repeat protein [Candidatus Polarisedimenticolaceae bacterium]
MEARKITLVLASTFAAAALAACTSDVGTVSSQSDPAATPVPVEQTESSPSPVMEVESAGSTSNGPATLAEGIALRDAGKLEEAEATLVRASEGDPRSSRILVNLARVRLSRNDAAGALEASDKALGLTPNSASALHQKGRALAGLNRGAEAIEVLTTAREMAPENGYIANTLGWLMLTRGDAAGAVPHLEAARDQLPEVAYVRNNLGVAYERSGRTEDAISEYRAAVAAGDSGGKALKSLERLHAEPVEVGEDQGPADGGVDPTVVAGK